MSADFVVSRAAVEASVPPPMSPNCVPFTGVSTGGAIADSACAVRGVKEAGRVSTLGVGAFSFGGGGRARSRTALTPPLRMRSETPANIELTLSLCCRTIAADPYDFPVRSREIQRTTALLFPSGASSASSAAPAISATSALVGTKWAMRVRRQGAVSTRRYGCVAPRAARSARTATGAVRKTRRSLLSILCAPATALPPTVWLTMLRMTGRFCRTLAAQKNDSSGRSPTWRTSAGRLLGRGHGTGR